MKHTDIINIPCPRLELEWVKTGETWYDRECIYSLVLPLGELDIRRESSDGSFVADVKKAIIGKTQVKGGNGSPPIMADGKVDTPFRDGAHAKWDQQALGGNIPIVAVCGEKFTIID